MAPALLLQLLELPPLATFVKTASLTNLGLGLVITVVGCGLGRGGESSNEQREAGLSSGHDVGRVASGSSGGSTSDASGSLPGSSGGSPSDGSADTPFDEGSSADVLAGDSTTPDGGPSVADVPVDDSGADAATTLPEGGPSQGVMRCPPGSDAGLCDLTSSVCCMCPGCFAPYPTGCFPALTGCVGVVFTGVYARLTCGDSANCAAGFVCCAEFDTASALTGSSCLASCATSGAAQLCTTSAECEAGKTCQPLAAVPGFTACQ
jgi:hypothetical protein